MRTWIARLFVRQVAPSVSHPRPRFRPVGEPLEARDVPASYLWTPQNDLVNPVSFDNPGDWTDVNGGPGVGAPGPNDAAIFDGRASNADCPDMSGGTFALVWVYNYYRGRITLDGPVTTKQFIMDSAPATVDQPTVTGYDTDITVTGPDPDSSSHSFFWRAGTINSTSHVATLTVTGGPTSGLVEPGDGNTVATGNTLNYQNSAQVLMHTGTVLSGVATGIIAGLNTIVTVEDIELTCAGGAPPQKPPNIDVIDNSTTYFKGATTNRGLLVQGGGTAYIQGQKTSKFGENVAVLFNAKGLSSVDVGGR